MAGPAEGRSSRRWIRGRAGAWVAPGLLASALSSGHVRVEAPGSESHGRRDTRLLPGALRWWTGEVGGVPVPASLAAPRSWFSHACWTAGPGDGD